VVIDSLAEEKLPDGWHQLATAEELIDRLLQGRKPVEMAAQKVVLETQITKYQSLIFSADGLPSAVASLNKQLEEAQSELTALSLAKKGHTEESQLCALQQVLSDFKADVQGRADCRATAQKKAKVRQQERRHYLQQLREQLEATFLDMEDLEEMAGAAHTLLEEDTAVRDGDVISQLELMVSDLIPVAVHHAAAREAAREANAARDAANLPNPPQANDPPADSNGTAAAAEAAAAELEEAKQARLNMETQLANLQEMLNQQTKKQEERRQHAKKLRDLNADFERRMPKLTVDDLPTLSVPKGQHLAKQAQLHSLLAQWVAAGSTTAFTFADLVKHATLADAAPEFIRTVLGSSWEQWYPEEPTGHCVLPRQAALLIFASLERLAESWKKASQEAKTREAAADSYGAMVGDAKRRRASWEDAVME
jgi:hypothetical protein